MSSQDTGNESNPITPRVPVRIAQLGELSAYIVYEHELDALASLDAELGKEPPDLVYLNFALFLLPISISFLITLLTTTIRSNRVYEVFVIVSAVSFITSLILFALWIQDRRLYHQARQRLIREREKQIQTIKNRLPPNQSLQAAIIIPEVQP